MLRRALPFDTCVAVEVLRAVGLQGLVGRGYRVRACALDGSCLRGDPLGGLRDSLAWHCTPHLLQILTVYCPPPLLAGISGN